MSKYVGLTEKRMADKRFRKTEEAILKVFLKRLSAILFSVKPTYFDIS